MAATGDAGADRRWQDAVLAAALIAIDPPGLGGVVLRSRPGPARDRWLTVLRAGFLADGIPVRRVPLHAGPDRLLGGLDLGATLSAGRPVLERGLLASADGGLLVLAMAERLPGATVGLLASALDRGEIRLERDGFAASARARVGVIALDESLDDEDRPSPALRDRLAFDLDLDGLCQRDLGRIETDGAAIRAARARLSECQAAEAALTGLTAVAAALGIASLRAPFQALRAARAAAALRGASAIGDEDAATAARLVLAPRATRLPLEPPEEPDDARQPQDEQSREIAGEQEQADRPLEDRLLDAALAALPPGLLDALQSGAARRGGASSSGRSGAVGPGGRRGRPAGIRCGRPGGGERLGVIDTLRAAAPWQPLRRGARALDGQRRVEIKPEDFRIIRRKQPQRATTIFVVDASGSSALQRLAEAKGAVELLLAACYTRRDQVALLAFRGEGADLLLAPTRSLARAKRSLAGLPGGGGTPLAAGVQAALQLAEGVRRRGETPLLVFLTDGRGNIAVDGARGRHRAMAEAAASARRIAAAGHAALVIDIAARPGPEAGNLAAALGARYLPLPRADARALSDMVRAARPR
jgi:magnesium chelatase subunit D